MLALSARVIFSLKKGTAWRSALACSIHECFHSQWVWCISIETQWVGLVHYHCLLCMGGTHVTFHLYAPISGQALPTFILSPLFSISLFPLSPQTHTFRNLENIGINAHGTLPTIYLVGKLGYYVWQCNMKWVQWLLSCNWIFSVSTTVLISQCHI